MLSDIAQSLLDKYLQVLYNEAYNFGETIIERNRDKIRNEELNEAIIKEAIVKDRARDFHSGLKAVLNQEQKPSINNPTLPTEADQLRAELVKILNSGV